MKLTNFKKQLGLSLIELLVSMAIGATVMSGVVSVLIVSKSNFISERELATLQENARFAVKFLTDEIRMAGFNGCSTTPFHTKIANSISGSTGTWNLDGTGIRGFEYEAGNNSFPSDFKSNVLANTDAIVVRRGENNGLSVNGSHNPSSANLPLNKTHDVQKGEIMVIASPDCQQVGIFQVSGPVNTTNNASHLVHNTGGSTSPGNCTKKLTGDFDCTNSSPGTSNSYPSGSRVMRLKSTAFYIGTSSVGNGIPALYRGVMGVDASYTNQELVQGVENMQILYGVDNDGSNDDIADIYLKGNSGAMNWGNVVSVRLFLRMRSNYPVYNKNEPYAVFQGVTGTSGNDRFMRQLVTTTIQLRN